MCRVPGLVVLGDHGERRIEQVVTHGRRIDQHQTLDVRVDAVLKSQIHQHGPREHVAKASVGHAGHVSGLLVEQEEEDLLGESQPRELLHAGGHPESHRPDAPAQPVHKRANERERSSPGAGAIRIPTTFDPPQDGPSHQIQAADEIQPLRHLNPFVHG